MLGSDVWHVDGQVWNYVDVNLSQKVKVDIQLASWRLLLALTYTRCRLRAIDKAAYLKFK